MATLEKISRRKFLGFTYWKKIRHQYRIRKYFFGFLYFNQFDYQSFLQTLAAQNRAISAKLEALDKQSSEIKNFVSTRLPQIQFYTGENGWEHKFMHTFYSALHDEHFGENVQKLLAGLDLESMDTVVRALNRLLQTETNKGHLNIFTPSERESLQSLAPDFHSKIIKLKDDLFRYENYLLPIKHFESSVFHYRHGLGHVNNLEHFKDKNIIDAGGFIGDSALILSPLTTKKVYVFEAMSQNLALLAKTIELNGLNNVVVESVALGEEPGELDIIVCGSCSTIGETTNENIQNPSTEKVQVDTIDRYVAAHNLDVGLIKVDVEGFEQPLLRGAINTIKTQRPTLLISIYHSMDDFFNIKPLIESWDLGYNFKIVKPADGAILLETLLIAEVPRP